MRKYIKDFVTGDIVSAHGGKFRVISNAVESCGHRPRSGHLVQAPGPSCCAVAEAVCIAGCVPGYFKVGTPWTFQGNLLAGMYEVEV